jgi:sugar/nucleoside kinase (ribokinase family)
MKILAIGHLCLDVIHPADGEEVEGYGGVYYTVGTLAALAGDQDTILPVFGVHKQDYAPLLEDLARYPRVDTSGIFTFDAPTNRVHLYYKNQDSRIECSKDIAQPIPFERIRRFLGVDGVLVNMISGWDITLETLDQIRIAVRSQNVPIHLDLHSLTLGISAHHERFRRPLSDWRRWGFMIDVVQMNEEEIGGLTAEHLPEQQTAGHLLTLGIRAVLVTRGARGVTVYYNEQKRLTRKEVSGISVAQPHDATGCGDVFGAAFHYHYVRTRDPLESAQVANRVAAAKVGMSGSDQLGVLKTSYA